MGAIDVHTHAFPDKLAPRAIAELENRCPWTPVGNGTIDGLIESMDAAGVDVSVVCAIATKPDQVRGILKWCEHIRSDRIEPFPSVHPETPKPAKWMKRFAKAKFAGVKLHPMYQDFAFDEARMDPVYAEACEHNLIIVAHCGRDIAFPGSDTRASPQRIRNVIDRYPNLKLICTHLGGWRSWNAVEQHIIGCEVHLETSFSLEELPRQRAADMIKRHGSKRVMLGSDWPWKSQADSIRRIRHLGLDKKTTEGILWSNAARLLRY